MPNPGASGEPPHGVLGVDQTFLFGALLCLMRHASPLWQLGGMGPWASAIAWGQTV